MPLRIEVIVIHGDEEDNGDDDGGDCYHDRDRQAESNHKKQLH